MSGAQGKITSARFDSYSACTIIWRSQALLSDMRALQGNCSSSNPVDALTLTRDVSDDLLPLKPHQCLLIVSKTWLMVNSGQVWIDNLYLKLNRRQVEPSFAFVTIGSPYRSSADVLFDSTVGQSDTYLTGITFHGEHRGNARGVNCDVLLASFLVDGTVRNEECNLRPVLVS